MKTFADLSFVPHEVDPSGIHARMNFENGYGVSVIRTYFSYGGNAGKYEMAVMKGDDLCHNTPITSDVLPRLSEEDVTEKMMLVQQLPSCLAVEKDSGFFAMATESSDRALQILAEMEIVMTKTTETRTAKFYALRMFNHPDVMWLATNEYGDYYTQDLTNEDLIRRYPADEDGNPFDVISWESVPGEYETVQLVPIEIRTEITIGSTAD